MRGWRRRRQPPEDEQPSDPASDAELVRATLFDNQAFAPLYARYRDDILEQKVGQWVDGCPSTEGGKNWQAMSFNRPTRRLIIPLSQSCIAIRAQAIAQTPGGGSARRLSSLMCPNGRGLYLLR